MAWRRSSQRALILVAAAILAAVAFQLVRPPPPTQLPVADDPRLDVRIDLNAAGAAELEALPGVGPALAARIVAHRNANGPFAGVDGLSSVPGVGPRTVEALRGLVTVETRD